MRESTKVCSKCWLVKPTFGFTTSTRNKDKLAGWCKVCRNAYFAQRYNGVYAKNKTLARYGVDSFMYEQMLAEQGGACAICKTTDAGIHNGSGKVKAFDVDHDHKTGVVRGLLCNRCNRGIGMLGDDTRTLLNAHAYLSKFELAHA